MIARDASISNADQSKAGDGFTVGDINAVLWRIKAPLSSAQFSAIVKAAQVRAQGGDWKPSSEELRALQAGVPPEKVPAISETRIATAEETGDPPKPPEIPEGSKIHDPETGELLQDSEGRTWDERIHAPSQMQLKGTGTWKREAERCRRLGSPGTQRTSRPKQPPKEPRRRRPAPSADRTG